MKNTIFKWRLIASVSFLVFPFIIFAQYPYASKVSERFFSKKEMRDVYYNAAKEVFEFNKVPEEILKNNEQPIISELIIKAKPELMKQFRQIEFYNETGIHSAVNSKLYNSVKQHYTKSITRAVEQAFLNNNELRKYIVFNTTDRIVSFKSEIFVQKSGKLKVAETITIYNGDGQKGPNEDLGKDGESSELNDQIKRGIMRTFPVVYVGNNKLFFNTTFKVLSVERKDDPTEKWQLKEQSNGYALYIGKPDYYLPNGFYTYIITYETNHQQNLTDNEDKLAWNVTGNGWDFEIESAQCIIHLPKGADGLEMNCATGATGSVQKDCNFSKLESIDEHIYEYKTTRRLPPMEGLTVLITFKSGVVAKPTLLANFWWLMLCNKPVFIILALLVFITLYYVVVWRKVGKDPEPGTIIPEFVPPAGLSPAAMGYTYFQKFTNQLTAATIVDLAVNKILKIDVSREGLIFKSNAYSISAGSGGNKKIDYNNYADEASMLIGEKIISGSYNSALLSFSSKLTKEVERTCRVDADGNSLKQGFFSMNNRYATAPLVISVLSFIVCFIWAASLADFNYWILAWMAVPLVFLIVVNSIFIKLLYAYNKQGRQVRDLIEGFRMYLTTTDEQRLNAMNPPDKTLELYEKFLPFAIALDCEVAWGKKFEAIIDSATMDSSSRGYAGLHSSTFSSAFVSSFSSSIASASSPPSQSSSGSSSGGFSSGSGGGGGGGGGW